MVARVLLCGCYGYLGWLLRCCYAVARVLRVVARVPGWLLRCCYGVARVVLGVVASVPEVVARVLLECCYAVAKVPRVVARCCYALLGYPGWMLGAFAMWLLRYPGW